MKVKNILAENMIRFGSKNLSELDRKKLQSLMEAVSSTTIDATKDVEFQKAIKTWWTGALADPEYKNQDTLYGTTYVGKTFIASTYMDDPPKRSTYYIPVMIQVIAPVMVGSFILPYAGDTRVEVVKQPNNQVITSFAGDPVTIPAKVDITGMTVSLALSNSLGGNTFKRVKGRMPAYLSNIKPNFVKHAAATIQNPNWKATYDAITSDYAKSVLDTLGYKPV